MKDRDYFYKKAKMTNEEDDWNIAKFCRNQTNFNVRKAKAEYIKEQLRNSEGNSSKFWRLIKQIIPNKKGQQNNTKISIKKDKNGAINDCELAGIMNEFFANLGNPQPKGKKPIPTLHRNDPNMSEDENEQQNESDPPFDLILFSRFEIENLIRKVNISKSSGITLLSSRLLKESFLALCDKLTYLFNLSIKQCIFPTQWKKALIIPIPKTADPQKVENYRPISLLPLPGKILEKLVHKQLSLHLEDNEYLSDNQFGFRKQRSTTHAISQLLNQIYTNINKSAITAAIYIDFSKAFNCVQHSTLVDKLSEFNISKNVVGWLQKLFTRPGTKNTGKQCLLILSPSSTRGSTGLGSRAAVVHNLFK